MRHNIGGLGIRLFTIQGSIQTIEAELNAVEKTEIDLTQVNREADLRNGISFSFEV